MMQRNRAQEVGHADEQVARPEQSATLFLILASTSALDQVFNLNESSCSPNETMQRVRRYCGRWLALRRLRLGVSNQVIAERTGVDAGTLLALELGLNEAQQLTDTAVEQLGQLLAPTYDDAAFVTAVIDVVRGRSGDQGGDVMERVMADFDTMEADPERE